MNNQGWITRREVFGTTTGREDEQEDDEAKQARPHRPQSRPDPRQDFTQHDSECLLPYL